MAGFDDIAEHATRCEDSLLKMDWIYDSKYRTAIEEAKQDLQYAKDDLKGALHGTAPAYTKEFWSARVRFLEAAIRSTRVGYGLGLLVGWSYDSDERALWTGDGLVYLGQEDAPVDYSRIMYYSSPKEAEKSTEFREYLRASLQIPKAKRKWQESIRVFEIHVIPEPYLTAVRAHWMERKVRRGVERS